MAELSPFERLREATSAYQEPAVLAAMAELDISTCVLEHGGALTAAEIAALRDADVRGVEMLMDVLVALGYFTKTKTADGTDAKYSVAEAYRELLDSRHPNTFIPMIRHLAAVQRGWTQLSWVVQGSVAPQRPIFMEPEAGNEAAAAKSGGPVRPSFLGHEEEFRAFLWAMNSIARTLAGPMVVEMKAAGVLDFEKENVHFLDVGGASGTYTQALLEALPGAVGTLFDLPPGVEAARKRFTGTAFEPRVKLVAGDFYVDDLPPGQDFVWVSAIIHQHGIPETRELFRKIFAAMNPGGKIAVRDFVMDESRTAPAAGAFFGINMLANTKTGMVYTFAEVKDALEAEGFTDVTLAVPAESMSAVVTARKA